MCLAAIALAQSERFPFVLASNRDEFFHRAATPLAWWTDADGAELLGGRDLSAGGTWLAVNRAGRLAFVTNVREPGRVVAGSPSRGELVPRWLAGSVSLREMAAVPRNGFNFMAAELSGAASGLWFSNRPEPRQRLLGPGVHGVSNAALDTPWPKTVALKQRLAQALAADEDLGALRDGLFDALAQRQPAPDAELPATGIPLERERRLSPAFIRIEGEAGVYGTRCSTLVIAERSAHGRRVLMIERRFDERGAIDGQTALAFDLAG